MAGYKFKLQKLLDLRISTEEEKKNQLGLALKRLEQEKDKLRALHREMDSMKSSFAERTKQGMGANELKIIVGYIDYYKRSIKEQKTSIKMAEDYVSGCRAELIKATQEKKMMEKLKEMDYNKFLYQEQKKEEKLVDDLVSFKESKKS